MPELSRFFGIVIRRDYSDHDPPHFHAVYGDREAVIEIEALAVAHGDLPRLARALVLEWAAMHRGELRNDWSQARVGENLQPIPPLEWKRNELAAHRCRTATRGLPRSTHPK